MNDDRLQHLNRFYDLLSVLEAKLGGPRKLSACTGYMEWPQRGVYFFREAGEIRSFPPHQPRIVRVGTHALTTASSSTLWLRLKQHRGAASSLVGNHRGSVFRLLVGSALIARDGGEYPLWGSGNSAAPAERKKERNLEKTVSQTIGEMTLLWLKVNDEPGSDSLRGFIEKNAIALLSNFERQPLDPPSDNWLGNLCPKNLVRQSGLWNQNHVDECYDPTFLDTLETQIKLLCDP